MRTFIRRMVSHRNRNGGMDYVVNTWEVIKNEERKISTQPICKSKKTIQKEETT